MSNFFPIQGFDHLEFYVGNARQAALFYSQAFGFTNTAYRGLETGERKTASYVMEQGEVSFVLSSGLNPNHPISKSTLHHGDGIAIIALEVPNATIAYRESTARGAVGAIPPTEEQDEYGIIRYAAIHIYGDILLKFVECSNYTGVFAPGFQPQYSAKGKGVGLTNIDHVVANVELGAMERWAKFFSDTMGFKLLVHFDDQTISTEYSALMSKVMLDSTGKIKLPINEPAPGKRKSQIEEYLEYNQGPGIQHVACGTSNIIKTVSQLRASGVEFLNIPTTYYENLEERVGKIEEPFDKLAELGILVDRDRDGYLLQIFTQPVEDRPTLFFEVIERHGSQGFGEGNFKALFEAIEREQARRGNL
ncbi:MAG: 4-hydroxyphenylpyruvate dioxygenase [Symploca sp. SIO1C4]|uniref:4-hydroxyphenylpyruvate dioxygenase n=1 Tax=Symploca sp. SIO1C4 TaxID=2607765 RepID=A0A6B3N8Y7_9CYAN|nr:4-hydroxyphenylpyruvate dioxygenase [Symploca sp. SIO1C4]